MSAGFFEDPPVGEVPRTTDGMPLIRPHDDPASDRAIVYTRASGLADYLADLDFLARWEKRLLAQSIGRRPELAAMAAAETYTTGLDKPTSRSGLAMNSASGRRLDTIVQRALDAGGVHERADYGTAVHAWTEPGGVRPVPDIHTAQADVAAWDRDIERFGIKIIDTEVFLVNDELQVAGTTDHILWVPGYGYVIDDKKTGKVKDFAVQLGVYANSKVYDPATGLRTTLERHIAELTGVDESQVAVRRDVALVSMIVAGEVAWMEEDIVRGLERARLAAGVRDARADESKPVDVTRKILAAARKVEPEPDDRIMVSIGGCQTHEELELLWHGNRDTWKPAHTAAAVARKAELNP